MRRITALVLSLSAGCTGMSLGENSPGQDTWLDPPPPPVGEEGHNVGALAVESDEEHVFAVHTEWRGDRERSHLAAIDPQGGAVDVLDVTDTSDRRIMFPSDDRALLMAQAGGREHLVLLDTETLTEIRRTTKPTWYWGTRRSPTGKFLAVADNNAEAAPIHVLDLATLEHVVVPHGGDSLEAMWNRTGDQLLAISVKVPENGAPPVARLLRWTVTSVRDWPEPDLDVALPGYEWDFAFSFTWIGVSPDDRWAVFPVLRHETGEHVLIVLDQADGTTREIGGRGPVGFTPDGSSIVSYGYDDNGSGVLHMIDPVTLETELVPVPIEGGLSFFVTWDGNFVVCTSVFSSGRLVIYEPDTGESVQVDGPWVALTDFVTRPGAHQLWVASQHLLHRLRLDDAVLEVVTVPFDVLHVNILPVADELVLSQAQGPAVWFMNLETTMMVKTVELPSPIDQPVSETVSP
jgi:hypothetical protein